MLTRILLILIVLLAGLALGAGLGLYLGWNVWPVQYSDTDLPSLRQDYRDDYVMMVASAYGWDGDLGRAQTRLAALDPADPAAPVADVIARRSADAAPADLQRLNRLLVDLRAQAPPVKATATP